MKVLIVEDNHGDFVLLQEYVMEAFDTAIIVHAVDLTQATKLVVSQKFDVILSHLTQREKDDLKLLEMFIQLVMFTPIILIAGMNEIATATKALQLGVQDYLIKDDINTRYLGKSILYSIERIKFQLQLQKSEEQYKILFNKNPQPMWMYDVDSFKILQVNEAAIHKYGYSETEFLNSTLLDVRPKNEHQKFISKATTFDEGKIQFVGIWQHLKKDGTIMQVAITTHDIIFKNQQCRLAMIQDA